MLTIKEASQLTGASESSIRVWLSDESTRKKRFPGARLEQPRAGAAFWLIPVSDLKNFEMGKPGPKPGAKKKAESKKGKTK